MGGSNSRGDAAAVSHGKDQPTQVADSSNNESGLGKWAKDFWGKAKNAGGQALDKAQEVGGDVVDSVKKIDTEKLVENGKQVGDKVVKGVQGRTGNAEADRAIREAGNWIPGAGTLQEGAKLLDKSGVLTDGENRINQQDIQNAARRAGPEVFGVPKGVQDLQRIDQVLRRVDPEGGGLSERTQKALKGAADAAEGKGEEVVTQGKADASTGLPEMSVVKEKAGKAADAVGGWFKRTFTSGDKDAKK